jgi:hypothetical protein
VIDSAWLAVCCGLLKSAACTVKLKVPAAVGVPEITPVDGSSDNPPGSDPELTDHLYVEITFAGWARTSSGRRLDECCAHDCLVGSLSSVPRT